MDVNFDDYKYKDTNHKLTLKIKQIKEKKLNPWEISSFLNRFNTYYYKDELLNTISMALMKDIEPENIIVFDQSFKLNQIHGNLKYIGINNEGLKYLYYVGLPISLYPNETILVLNLLFKYFRQYNELLATIKKAKCLSTKDLFLYYRQYTSSNNFTLMLEKISLDVNFAIEKVKLEKSQKETLNKIYKNFESSHESYKKDENLISIVKQKIQNNQNIINQNELEILKKYFQHFFNALSNIQRPLVMVKNIPSNTFSILCRAQINKLENKTSTLDLKSISHNSPVEAIIKGSISLYKIFVQGDRTALIAQKREKINEIYLLLNNNELPIAERIIKETDIQRLELEINAVTEIQRLENLNPVYSEQIENRYIKKNIQEQENTNQNNGRKILKDTNFKEDLTFFNLDIEL